MEKNSKERICSFCGEKFACRQSLWQHKNRFHSNTDGFEAQQRQPTLLCGECKLLFNDQTDICKHVSEAHQFQANIKSATFENIDEFNRWKKESERDGLFEFIQRAAPVVNKSSIERKYFYCHRSGEYIPLGEGLRAPRENKTNRVGFQCTVFVYLRTDTLNVTVTYCLDHYGHDHKISRLRLPENVRQQVKQYLEEKRDFDWILDKLRNNFGRTQLITRLDVHNIQRSFGLREAEKHPDDTISVATWINEFELKEQEEGSISPFFAFNPLQIKDGIFTLGIQTAFQKQMMEAANSTFCVDATHGTTHYVGYLLVTILIVAESGKGYPVAWFIVYHETYQVLEICFKALRERTDHQIVTETFMSDDAPQYWNAWRSAFGDTFAPDVKKLLCTWHVLKNWRQNVRSKITSFDDQIRIWHRLNVIIRMTEEGPFRHLLSTFLTELGEMDDESGVDFLRYFQAYYCDKPEKLDRINEWALWARRGAIVNTNMFLESFHRTLKYKFLRGRQNRRMDTLVHTLLSVAQWFLHEYAVVKLKGVSASSKRLAAMHKRHQYSTAFTDSDVRHDNDAGIYFIKSECETGREYKVRRTTHVCDCSFRCRWCAVCPFSYTCTCVRSVLAMVVCKHVHFVHALPTADREENENAEGSGRCERCMRRIVVAGSHRTPAHCE